MGKQARLNSEEYFTKNPFCIFCGGTTRANTREHCPPRALFQLRNWPEGFEFPSCLSCNAGTADDDVLVSLLGRMDPFAHSGDLDGKVSGLIKNANKQYPDLLQQMLSMTASESRKAARALNIKPPRGHTYQQIGIVKVTDDIDKAVCNLARKLSKAIYFKATENIFPTCGSIQLHWFTNADFFKYGTFPALDSFANIQSVKPVLVRNGKDLSDQFDYRYSFSEDHGLAVLRAVFGKSFGIVTIMSPRDGCLQKIDDKLKTKIGKEIGPFRFL